MSKHSESSEAMNIYEFLEVELEHSSYYQGGRWVGCGSSAGEAIDSLMRYLAEQGQLTADISSLLNSALADHAGLLDECVVYRIYARDEYKDVDVYVESRQAESLNTEEVIFDEDGIIDDVICDADQLPEGWLRDEVRVAIDNSEHGFYAKLDLQGLKAALKDSK